LDKRPPDLQPVKRFANPNLDSGLALQRRTEIIHLISIGYVGLPFAVQLAQGLLNLLGDSMAT
jgi:hypothetical protein